MFETLTTFGETIFLLALAIEPYISIPIGLYGAITLAIVGGNVLLSLQVDCVNINDSINGEATSDLRVIVCDILGRL